jgi:hypothetical protein
MGFGTVFILVLLVIGALIIYGMNARIVERERVAAMSPADRLVHIYGPSNAHLICPHCQSKGSVHVKSAMRSVTSTGKVGGILKTNTESTTINVVTQHHCEKCSSTWDI